ncbi:MAG: hypothetical protein ABIB04_03975 [Patescibacteria group bacterium]
MEDDFTNPEEWQLTALHCFIDSDRLTAKDVQKALELLAPKIIKAEGLSDVGTDPLDALNLRTCKYWEDEIGVPGCGVRVAAMLRFMYVSRFELKPPMPDLLDRLHDLECGEEIGVVLTVGPGKAESVIHDFGHGFILGMNRAKKMRFPLPSIDAKKLDQKFMAMADNVLPAYLSPKLKSAFARVLISLVSEICATNIQVGSFQSIQDIWSYGNLILGLNQGTVLILADC